jgi:hypothetical protein
MNARQGLVLLIYGCSINPALGTSRISLLDRAVLICSSEKRKPSAYATNIKN